MACTSTVIHTAVSKRQCAQFAASTDGAQRAELKRRMACCDSVSSGARAYCCVRDAGAACPTYTSVDAADTSVCHLTDVGEQRFPPPAPAAGAPRDDADFAEQETQRRYSLYAMTAVAIVLVAAWLIARRRNQHADARRLRRARSIIRQLEGVEDRFD